MADSRKPRRRRNTALIGLRINNGLSRADLARRVGVSAETIRLCEYGWVPGPRVQYALASEFKLNPLDIWPIEVQRIDPRRPAVAT